MTQTAKQEFDLVGGKYDGDTVVHKLPAPKRFVLHGQSYVKSTVGRAYLAEAR
jgi:hypothetical protein